MKISCFRFFEDKLMLDLLTVKDESYKHVSERDAKQDH